MLVLEHPVTWQMERRGVFKYVFIPIQNEAQSARAESTHKGANWRWKYVRQVQQQRPESPTVTLTWHACKYKVHKLHQRYILKKGCPPLAYILFADVLLVELMYLVFTRMSHESYRRQLSVFVVVRVLGISSSD